MTDQTGQGDARRSMALLWGRTAPPTRGPKQGLSVERIVATAVALADAEGLDSLSMRKVGERLGTSAMALYTYVPTKAELLDLMLDRTLGELPTVYDRASGWRGAAQEWAAEMWAWYLRHPWVLQVASPRPLLGPNELATHEARLAIFDDLGLEPVEVVRVAGALTSYVAGAARAVAQVRTTDARGRQSEDDWWYERSALLDEMGQFDWEERFPVSSKLSAAGAFDQTTRTADDEAGYLERESLDDFTFGLARLLDGIAVLVESRRS